LPCWATKMTHQATKYNCIELKKALTINKIRS